MAGALSASGQPDQPYKQLLSNTVHMTENNKTNNKGIPRYFLPFLIVALGAFLRFEAIDDTKIIAPLRADAGDYVSYAVNLLEYGTFSRRATDAGTGAPRPDALRSPGYPFFLAGTLYLSTRAPLVFVQYLQALLSTLTIVLTLLLCRRFLPPVLACSAAFFTAISPHLVVSNVYLLTESLFTFALTGSLLLLAYLNDRNGKGRAFLSGVTLGVLTLIRPAVQYFIVALIALLRLEGKPLRGLLVIVLGFSIVFGAWATRNMISTGSASDNTLMVNFLHHGMYPDFRYRDDPDTYGFPYRHDPDSASVSTSASTILSELLRRFREEPARHFRWFLLGKPVAFWQWDIVQGMGDVYIYPVERSPYFTKPVFQWTHALSKLLHAPLVVLGLLGSVACWFLSSRFENQSARFSVRLIASLIIYYQLIHMAGAPFPRYSVPLRPLIYAMAMYFVYASTGLIRRQFHRRDAAP